MYALSFLATQNIDFSLRKTYDYYKLEDKEEICQKYF